MSERVRTTERVWSVLTLALAYESVDAVAAYVRQVMGREPVQLERPGAAQTWLEIYFDHEDEARDGAASIQELYTVLASAVRRCDSRDWESFWRLHFSPHPVGKRLWICPAWETDSAGVNGRHRLLIVPGLSFGTGEHFTTQFCLEMIDRLAVPDGPCRTLWDAGCGSGILAVAGALLGIDEVLGTDSDPLCLVQSAENAQLNQVSEKMVWQQMDVAADALLPTERTVFDLVCANLYGSLLIKSAPTLWNATGLYLALSGIRETEVDNVAGTFLDLGAQEVVRDGDGEWVGLLFKR